MSSERIILRKVDEILGVLEYVKHLLECGGVLAIVIILVTVCSFISEHKEKPAPSYSDGDFVQERKIDNIQKIKFRNNRHYTLFLKLEDNDDRDNEFITFELDSTAPDKYKQNDFYYEGNSRLFVDVEKPEDSWAMRRYYNNDIVGFELHIATLDQLE